LATICKEKYRVIDYIIPLFNINAYSGFSNQPDGDTVEVVSNSASDTGKCTIFGTVKTTGVFKYETVTLTGTVAVTTTEDDWDDIYGVFLGDIYGKNTKAAVGTITFREGSTNQAITTVSAGELGIGMQVFYGLQGQDVTVINVSGNLYLYDNGLASTANGYPFASAEKFNFIPAGSYFSLISDASAATAKIVVWK